jgi:hypothetical protein
MSTGLGHQRIESRVYFRARPSGNDVIARCLPARDVSLKRFIHGVAGAMYVEVMPSLSGVF